MKLFCSSLLTFPELYKMSSMSVCKLFSNILLISVRIISILMRFCFVAAVFSELAQAFLSKKNFNQAFKVSVRKAGILAAF